MKLAARPPSPRSSPTRYPASELLRTTVSRRLNMGLLLFLLPLRTRNGAQPKRGVGCIVSRLPLSGSEGLVYRIMLGP
jgi:hypothetical protein